MEKREELFAKIEYIKANCAVDEEAISAAKARQIVLAKPTGALGELENIAVKLAGITGKVLNDVKKQAVLVFSADNGVATEGVASAPQSVTYSQTFNFSRHFTGVSALANYFDVDLMVLDMGVKTKLPEGMYTDEYEMIPGGVSERGKIAGKIVNRRLGCGTESIVRGAAMTDEQMVAAILTGIEAVEKVKSEGYEVFGVGEMGIGNTTTASAVLAALTGAKASEFVGRGGGLNNAGLKTKCEIVDRVAGELNGASCLEVLKRAGGFDIAAMVGAYLGAAYYRVPCVIDGYISAVAALVAYKLASPTRDFMFASHVSLEPGYLLAMKELGLSAMFDLKMRLGEGSGCPIAFKIMEAACATMSGMATFDEGSIDADYLKEAEKGDFF